MTVVETLEAFLEDEKAYRMFITGRAGTGKTTSLREAVQYCMDNNIPYLVCAFTHKACGVLAEKLPDGALIGTLHAWLKKRPGINQHATDVKHVDIRTRQGTSERPRIVFIDEFSMVGEQDYVDILAMQDPHGDDPTIVKAVYIGDPYQLPPVGDLQTIKPKGPYWVRLTKRWRTDKLDLLNAMDKVISFIEGADPEPIPSSENLIRGQDLVKHYKASTCKDKQILAWTNKRVQELNFAIAGKSAPDSGELLWDSTRRHELRLKEIIPAHEATTVSTAAGHLLPLGTKYKTLEFLQELDFVQFANVSDETEGSIATIAFVFGTYNHKVILQRLTQTAVDVNQEIERTYKMSPAIWARANYNNPLAKERAKAWRTLLAFKEVVLCVDFSHAMTVHKSQGSTYEEVYMDTEDLASCGAMNMTMYFKLFYVGLSRASHKVITN